MKKTTSIEKTKKGCFWQDFITEAGEKRELFYAEEADIFISPAAPNEWKNKKQG